jgi:hypothetical protein
MVLAACFCEPHAPYLLVTAGEDRTFKVTYYVAGNGSMGLIIDRHWPYRLREAEGIL